MIGSALTLWLKEAGLSRSEIGYAGAIFVAYSVNFLWSPLIDRIGLKRLGQRRGWILSMQFSIACSCLFISTLSAEGQLPLLIAICLIIALSSATQDIAIDAYRIDSFEPSESQKITASAAAATAGWWTGYAGLGFIPLWMSDLNGWSWPEIYAVLGFIVLLLMLIPLFSPEPKNTREKNQSTIENQYLQSVSQHPIGKTQLLICLLLTPIIIAAWGFSGSPGVPKEITNSTSWLLVILTLELLCFALIGRQIWLIESNAMPKHSSLSISWQHRLVAWLLVSLVQPIREFFQRNGIKLALSILAFIFLFKMGEAFLGRMSIVFYKELGFSNTVIGYYSKLLTWLVTVGFSVGSIYIFRTGVVKGLLFGGIAMAASNLMFSWMAISGPSEPLFIATIVVDGFTSAWSTVAFVALLSLLCNRTFTATQYALMISLGALGKTLLSSASGQLVDSLNGNWALFFALTALMVIPSLLILLSIRGPISALEQERNASTATVP